MHRAEQRFPSITAIVLNRNEGAVARNYGSYAANTPFVAFCDDDSWWAPGALARAEALFDAFPRLGLIAARTLVGVEQRDDPVNHELLHSPLGHDDSAPGPSVLGFLACSSIVRRSAFLEAGGFSSVLEFAGEESLLAYDLAAAGWMLCYAEDVVSHHHPSERRMPTVKRRNRQRRNELLTMWMRRPLGRCFTANLRLGLSVMREPAVAGAAVGTAVALPQGAASAPSSARRRRTPGPHSGAKRGERVSETGSRVTTVVITHNRCDELAPDPPAHDRAG